MDTTKTHLQKLLLVAQRNHNTVTVLTGLVAREVKSFETSKDSLTAGIYHIFHTTMSGNVKALSAFKSKCLRLVLDEPAEVDFLTEAVTAVVNVLLDPEHKSVDIDLVLGAVDMLEGNRFPYVQKRLEEESGIVIALIPSDGKYTFSVCKG